MANEALGQLLYKELDKIRQHSGWTDLARVDACYQLLTLVFVEATRQERLRFSTLFSRIAYASQKHRLDRSLQFYLHAFRKQAADAIRDQAVSVEKTYLPDLGYRVLLESIEALSGAPVPEHWKSFRLMPWPYPQRPAEIQAFKPTARVVALEDFPLEKQFLIKDEGQPESDLRMQYDLADYNEGLNPSIALIRRTIGFPVILQLIDIEIDQEGVYRPRAIAIEPDYLLDVSAIAECFKDNGAVPETYLLKKFLPFSSSLALLQGNIANFFLDELMHDIQAGFRETFAKVFQLNPLAMALISDQEVKTLQQQSQKHFANLQQVILRDFPALGIQARECYLEPSFYAHIYGIQGRLDVFFLRGNTSAIVELKSGKVYKPNAYGISSSHYIQTLLYDLIIRAVFGRQADPSNYILYSGVDERPLRFAPVVKTQQYEALQVRNQLLAMEYELGKLGCNQELGREDLLIQGKRWLARLQAGRLALGENFVKRDQANFLLPFQTTDETEQRYFFAFTGFIAREHKLAKTGMEGIETLNGQSALWRTSLENKEADFNILSFLEVKENLASGETAQLRFSRTAQTNRLANFRTGDIATLYPMPEPGKSPLSNQLFKCTITSINADEVLVQLRARQSNDQLFRDIAFWNLEHDLMDISFIGMYRGLFEFLNSPTRWRQLLLGRIPPEKSDLSHVEVPEQMTAEQQSIFQKIVASKDYFLLWGPPGTGKTSIMLKYLCGYWLQHSTGNLLLLAYTNRAVDEICAAIESFDPSVRNQYLRIGSRFSTAPEFHDRLLSVQTEHIHTRKGLKDLIDRQRIIVATVAAIAGKTEILSLKHFDRVVIDEASQIPEPMLVGFLPRFRHALLIGDHKQLPAVVTQDELLSTIEDPALNELGISNLRNSFFERLYKRCQTQNWHWAFSHLSHQGRMHEEVMAFPNRVFYEGQLKILPDTVEGHQVQVQVPVFRTEGLSDPLQLLLTRHRMLFFSTPSDEEKPQQKTNIYEARLASALVLAYQQLYLHSGKIFSTGSLGIITPYRAQIAQIRQALQETGVDAESITIDTVERYQGGARDIILLSLCTNSLSQMRALVSLSDEGIDRKLNVALTRARESVVILGNPALLEQNAVYLELLSACHQIDYNEI